ncbi:MAG: hypothetical protein H7X99_09170 [Saprospiraceae bacterium]|nr:hypothetical protein [Saprospiraceae bacterium]
MQKIKFYRSTFKAGSELDEKWGFDHDAWSVIINLYLNAEILVILLSIDYTKLASYHFVLASGLNELRNKGILIIVSDIIVHNPGGELAEF